MTSDLLRAEVGYALCNGSCAYCGQYFPLVVQRQPVIIGWAACSSCAERFVRERDTAIRKVILKWEAQRESSPPAHKGDA